MSTKIIQGNPIAPGYAVGPLHVPKGESFEKPVASGANDPSLEFDRFLQRLQVLEQEIEETVNKLNSEAFLSEAEIMRTHLTMLRDPDLHRQVLAFIQNSRYRAETAVEKVLESMAGMLAAAEDPLLAERAVDLRDLAMRMKAGFSERHTFDLRNAGSGNGDVIVALPELMPSMVLAARDQGVKGFIVEYGTSVSHGAILAKSFGMSVVRVHQLESVSPFAGRNILVWGGGEVLVEPNEAELEARRPPQEVIPIERAAGAPRLRVWISIVDPEQLEKMNWTGIEGVGLYRSEALFIRHREDFPSEQEQFEAYRILFELAEQRPVVFRTVDLGMDKPVEYMDLGPQDNPCMGLRAHRLFRFHPEILVTQIRAVLRAAFGNHRLRLMFPMVESIEQLRFVQRLVEQAIKSLAEDGLPYQSNFHQGVLVETPSAVWSFGRLLEEVDFASLGTNDLIQYMFAVERNTANVAELYQPDHPVVLQVIRSLAVKAADARKSLSMCGEMAGDPLMLPVLVGLGMRDLSVAPGCVATTLQNLGILEEVDCRRLAEQCLVADTVNDVRALLGRPPIQSTFAQPVGEGDALDPVCGMVVHVGDTPYVLHIGGLTHYFCSRSCLIHYKGHKEQAYVSDPQCSKNTVNK